MSSNRLSLSGVDNLKVARSLDGHLIPNQVNKSSVSSRKLNLSNSKPTNNSLSNPNHGSKPISLKKLALSAVKDSKIHKHSYLENQFIMEQQTHQEEPVKRQKRSLLSKSVYGLAVFVLVISSVASIQSIWTNKQAQDQIGFLGEQINSTDEQGVVEGTGSQPAEDPVSDQALANYQVSPHSPRYLKVPELGLFARIKPLGIDNKGAVDAPWNIHDVGWFDGSARPGNSIGSSLLLGHKSGWSQDGVFKNINLLKEGSEFVVEKGSGVKIEYIVTRVEEMPLDQVDMGEVLTSDVSGGHDLKLMTCSGRYDSDSQTYANRTVVYAVRI